MATFTKYDTFVESVTNKLVDVYGATDTVRAIIHTDAPVNASASPDSSLSNLIEIGGSNGYTTGGEAVGYTCARGATDGIVSFNPTGDITWTASGGNLGASTTGRYFSLYDDTSTANNLMCAFDYGATFTVATGETMTLDFGTTLWTLQ